MSHKRGEPRLLEVDAGNKPIKGRLASTVGAQSLRVRREPPLTSNATDNGADGDKYRVLGLAGLEQRANGLEEGHRADAVSVKVITKILRGSAGDSDTILGDTSIGNDDVEGSDTMLIFEKVNCRCGIAVDIGIEFDDGKHRTLALGKINKGFSCFGGVSGGGNYGDTGSQDQLRGEALANATIGTRDKEDLGGRHGILASDDIVWIKYYRYYCMCAEFRMLDPKAEAEQLCSYLCHEE